MWKFSSASFFCPQKLVQWDQVESQTSYIPPIFCFCLQKHLQQREKLERWAGLLTNLGITDAFQDHTLQMREGEKSNPSACVGSSHPRAPSTDPHTAGKLSQGLHESSIPTHPMCTHGMKPNRLFFHLGERKLKPCESHFASEGKQIGFA